MRIQSVRIKSLRSYCDETITFGQYNCLVGPNGSGKSTVLSALNIFFRDPQVGYSASGHMLEDDYHHKDITKDVEIQLTFTGLSAEAKKDFEGYVRQEQLVVSAVATYNPELGFGEVVQYGYRLGMKVFADFFRALNDEALVKELKVHYEAIVAQFDTLLKSGTKDQMVSALRDYEDAHPELCELIPSADRFYGFSKGANRLAKHVQWVFVPAVKDAAEEQLESRATALGKLLARTVRTQVNFTDRLKQIRDEAKSEYGALLADNQAALDDISARLAKRIADWAHPEAKLSVQWRQDPDKSVQVADPVAQILAGEAGFESDISRFGHGFQRSFLLAILQELSSSNSSDDATLILGCEEPELYQHPPQLRHLASVLRQLCDGNAQVILSTHSPLFVSGQTFEDVRMIRKAGPSHESRVSAVRLEELSASVAAACGDQPYSATGVMAKIHQALQPAINEMFFTNRLILAEGLEDIAYITTYLNLNGQWDDFRRLGCHIVQTGGKSEMIRPLAIAKSLGIPVFVVLDSDASAEDRHGSRVKHERDNRAIISLCGLSDCDAMPNATVWRHDFVMWPSTIGEVVASEIGPDNLHRYSEEADKHYGHVGGLAKNSLHIAMTMTAAWDEGKRSASLQQLCDRIIEFGDKGRSASSDISHVGNAEPQIQAANPANAV